MIKSKNAKGWWRYVWILGIFILFVVSVQAFVNYLNIQSQIQSIRDKDRYFQEEIAYLHRFQKPYLESDYYDSHQIHDMGLIGSGEYIIKIEHLETPKDKSRTFATHIVDTSTVPLDLRQVPPLDARKHLWNDIVGLD